MLKERTPSEKRDSAFSLHSDCLICAGCVVGLCFALSACSSAPKLSEPFNLSQAKEAVDEYCDSGAYRKDIETVSAEAYAWIERRAARRQPGEKLAIVLDIDETVLSNAEMIRKQDYGFVPADWDVWVAKAAAPAIEPMKKVFLRARALDIAVFFVTGRTEPTWRAATDENLKRQGMGDYAALYMKSEGGPKRRNAEVKVPFRAEIERQGYTIIANVGDQQTDLDGGHAEKTFKLPDPFYLAP